MTWPYRNILLTDADQIVRETTARALKAANECCLDAGISLKASKLVGTWQELLQHRPLLAAFNIWASAGMLGNMGCERMLALIRKSSPLRCYVERIIPAGLLAQVMSVHRKFGGHDVRKITRAMLEKRCVPIRARAVRDRCARAKLKQRNGTKKPNL